MKDAVLATISIAMMLACLALIAWIGWMAAGDFADTRRRRVEDELAARYRRILRTEHECGLHGLNQHPEPDCINCAFDHHLPLPVHREPR